MKLKMLKNKEIKGFLLVEHDGPRVKLKGETKIDRKQHLALCLSQRVDLKDR